MINGGSAYNIIPDSATVAGTFRAFNKKSFNALGERIQEVTNLITALILKAINIYHIKIQKFNFFDLFKIIKGQAAVHRCSAEVDFSGKEHPTLPPTMNDERIYQHVRRVTVEILGEENVKLAPIFTGSEDFAFFLDEIPGSFLLLGILNESIGSLYPPHSPHFAIDEDVLPIGAAIHAAFAHSYLVNSEN